MYKILYAQAMQVKVLGERLPIILTIDLPREFAYINGYGIVSAGSILSSKLKI